MLASTFSVLSVSDEKGGSRKRASTGSPQWTGGYKVPFSILGAIMGAFILALVHHALCRHLDGRRVAGFWSQKRVAIAGNAFANSFAVLYALALGICLCQMSWRKVQTGSFAIREVDTLLGPPSTSILLRPRLFRKAPELVAVVIMSVIAPFIPVFAPSALAIVPAPAIQASINVPSLGLPSNPADYGSQIYTGSYTGPTQLWEHTGLAALLSDNPIGWPAPTGCSKECSYEQTFNAPALKCQDVSPGKIYVSSANVVFPDDLPLISETNKSVYLTNENPATDVGTIANITTNDADLKSSLYTLTVAYINQTDRSATVPAKAVTCTVYNATYQLHTLFANNTQTTFIDVQTYHEPLNKTYTNSQFYTCPDGTNPQQCSNPCGSQGCPPGTIILPFNESVAELHLLALADSFIKPLQGACAYKLNNDSSSFLQEDSKIGLTKLFSLDTTNSFFNNSPDAPIDQLPIFHLNEAAGITNLSESMTALMANMTSAFFALGLTTDIVSATVYPDGFVFSYHPLTLLVTYGIALATLLVCGMAGLMSLHATGVPCAHKFSQFLATTRNPKLDALASGLSLGTVYGSRQFYDAEIKFGELEGMHVSGARHASFGVVGQQMVGPIRKGELYR